MRGLIPTGEVERLREKVARIRQRQEVYIVSINIVMLSGNLTRDAEVRQTRGGTSVTSYGIAVNDRRKNPLTNEWEDYANFFDVTMFGKYGEKLASSLTRGTKVALNGSLRYSQWEKDGQKRSKVEVVADSVEFMTKPEKPTTSLFDEECPF